MPELPEAEASRRLIETHCVGKKVVTVTAVEQGGGPRDGLFDDRVIDEGITAAGLAAGLTGRPVKSVHRQGKQIWLTFGGGGGGGRGGGESLLFHHGMTGCLKVKGQSSIKYARDTTKDGGEWPPRFTKLELGFAGGVQLAFSDPRRLGKVRLRSDPLGTPPISLLATDPVTDNIDAEALYAKLAKVNTPIKTVILDQQRVVAGVGNWIADDVLYQAGIHPLTTPSTMDRGDFERLAAAIMGVCRQACEVNADSKQFPRQYLFHMRWGKGTQPASQTLPDGRAVHHTMVGGRSTFFVPAAQKKSGANKRNNKSKPKPKPAMKKARAAAKQAPAVAKKAPVTEIEVEAGRPAAPKRKERAAASTPAKPAPKRRRKAAAVKVKKEEQDGRVDTAPARRQGRTRATRSARS